MWISYADAGTSLVGLLFPYAMFMNFNPAYNLHMDASRAPLPKSCSGLTFKLTFRRSTNGSHNQPSLHLG